MSLALDIIKCGAVSAVGLTAPQTCAAIRAGISGFRKAYPLVPPAESLLGAPVPARNHLKRTPRDWLLNLAAKAIEECTAGSANLRTAIIINLPEAKREHPALTGTSLEEFTRILQGRVADYCRGPVYSLQAGHAGTLRSFEHARELLGKGHVDQCVVGGVDSLLNEKDVGRLTKTYRIRGPDNAHGVILGEGAAFVLVSATKRSRPPLAKIVGLGMAEEADTVLGSRFSQGRGLQKAISLAVKDGDLSESKISFRVSDVSGERYREWESLLASMRFYQTKREQFPCWYVAAAVGDLGAAAGALALIVAATALSRGYAPGPVGMCEASSDEGLRAACLVERLSLGA